MPRPQDAHIFEWQKISARMWACYCIKCQESVPYTLVVKDHDSGSIASIFIGHEPVAMFQTSASFLHLPEEPEAISTQPNRANAFVLGYDGYPIAFRVQVDHDKWVVARKIPCSESWAITDPLTTSNAMLRIAYVRNDLERHVKCKK